jgi:hypothetical protein
MYAKFVHRALLTLLAVAYPAASFAGFFGVGVTVGFAPPPLPVYVQPPCPAVGYIWTPGYWAYSGDDQDYYWVPGTWVLAPSFGWLWTPGYWGLIDAEYVWHEGYWGPHVGFYGGINYGFGYFGSGFVGGYWRDHDYYYNRAVTNVSNVRVTNVYNRTVVNNNSYGSRPSFNGRNGVEARPTHGDLLAAREPHRALTAPQRSQSLSARTLPSSLASVNHGHPQIAATPRPGISNRDTSHYSPPMNTRQHEPNASAVQHAGYGANREYAPANSGRAPANTVRTSAANSRAIMAHASPRSAFRPPEPNRVSPSPANVPRYTPRAPQVGWAPAAHSPPGRQASVQAPRNAPAASHGYSQAPHVNRQAPPQRERRG